MESVSPQLAVLALTALLAVGTAIAAALRALLPATAPTATDSVERSTHIVWAAVPMIILAAVLAAVARYAG